MDITRDTIEKIVEMAEIEIIENEGVTYSSRQMAILRPQTCKPLETNGLDSIVDYLMTNNDQLTPSDLIIQVVDEREVKIISRVDKHYRTREEYIKAVAFVPDITFDRFVDREMFNIMLQSNFEDLEDKSTVLAVVGSMAKDNSVSVQDDGITQTVSAKTGVVLVKEATIPNPVKLAPFRTFTEVRQPVSPFVLRVDDNCRVALFAADGGAWKREAMDRIKAYLEKELGELYTIIA